MMHPDFGHSYFGKIINLSHKMHHKGRAYAYSQPWAGGCAAGSQPAGAATATTGGTAPSTGAGAPAGSQPSPVGTGAAKKKKERL